MSWRMGNEPLLQSAIMGLSWVPILLGDKVSMRALKLMADYQCFPLWEISPGAVGNVDPASLAISSNLIARLNEWAARFDSTLDLDDPMNSGFPSDAAEREFATDGRDLCRALQVELGDGYLITHS